MNAYAEPVVSLDLEIVVATEQTAGIEPRTRVPADTLDRLV